MSKKGTKALASATLMSLVLTTALSAGPVKAAAGQVTRTSGADRYATAAQVATSNWTTSDNVVLVSGEGYADAVSATALAKQLNAPILLTTAGSLDTNAASALTTLKAKNVYVVGGDASISQAVRSQLKNDGYALTELGGANRYATNAAVADELVKLGVDPSNVMMVGGEGFSDALSVAPIAAAKGQILLLGLNDANYMSPVIDFVKAHNSKVTVVGTTNVINNDIYSAVNAVSRVDGGQDRFDTNLKVLAAFKDTVKEDSLYVANASGDGYADALVASALAGKSAAPLVLVDSEGSVGTTNAVDYIKANATTKTDLEVIGGTGVVTDNTVADINNAVNPTTTPGSGTAEPGQAQVTSVTANSATSFQVKFAQAPADTSKITFSVTRGGTAVQITPSWDSTNTVATLTYSSNLPEDTYAVDVKDGDNDLGSTDVAITAQKIGKIVITSTALGVTAPVTVGGASTDTGYATYKVLDQYGNDITSSALAQSITWTCGIGNVDNTQTGILKVTPFAGVNNLLTQYTAATLNGIDQTSGVTTSANLTVTQSQGTLSSITLNKLYCTNNTNAVLTAGDSTDSFYIDYTATDLSGNTTNNYNLMKAGLMTSSSDTGNHITGLISSNPSALDVQLVTDPSNSNNALIQVTPGSSSSVVADQPVVITAFTTNGQSSSITLNLKKAAVLDKFTLMAPSQTVAAGDTNVIIPFQAYDQNGVAMTKYSDIKDNVTFSGTIIPTLIQNPDGTASLKLDVPATFVQSPLTSQSATIQAVTKNSGKFSSLNISVQKAKAPNTLSVTTTQAVPNMESGAVQNLDFGANFGDLQVKDQYGRAMDMTNQDISSDNYYFVEATTDASISNPSVKVVSGATRAYGNNSIQIQAVGGVGSGSTTITYTVKKHISSTAYAALDATTQALYMADPLGTGYVTKAAVSGVTPITQQYTVVDKNDIKDYAVDSVADLYDVYGTPKKAYIANKAIGKFEATPYVWGLLSGGGKVALSASDIVAVNVTNTGDFTVDPSANNTTGAGIATGLAEVGVYANNTLSSATNKTTASATLTVSVKGQDGLIHTATTKVNSVDNSPAAQSVGFSATQILDNGGINNVYTSTGSTSVSVNGNNVTMDASDFATHVENQVLTKYDASGNSTSSWVYLYAVDQYGTKTCPLPTLYATVTHANATTATPITLVNGQITGSFIAGDTITITGVTTNGLVDSVNITLK